MAAKKKSPDNQLSLLGENTETSKKSVTKPKAKKELKEKSAASKTKTKSKSKSAAKAAKPKAKSSSTKKTEKPAVAKSDKSSKKGVTKNLLVVDGHAMAYRAYFALLGQNLTNASGMSTTAIFGFFRMFYKLLDTFKPSHLVVTFDPGGKVFRRDIYKDYKANRKPMPDDLRPQIEEIQSILPKAGFKILKVPNYEADDVIGTIAVNHRDKADKIYLVTSDKDCYQLLDDKVHMIKGKKGITDFEILDTEWLLENLGITPDKVIDYMGIVGDSSDNIPGVAGIGPKGAQKLVADFDNLEGIYENIDGLSAGVIKKLEASKDNAFLSRELATIKTDVDLDIDFDSFETGTYFTEDRISIFRDEGYANVYADLKKLQGSEGAPVPSEDRFNEENVKYSIVTQEKDLKSLCTKLAKAKLICIDTETDSKNPIEATLIGISVATKPKEAVYISIPPEDGPFKGTGVTMPDVVKYLGPVLKDKKIHKIAQNVKYDLLVLDKAGLKLDGVVSDTMMESYLLNPNIRRHGLDEMANDRLGYATIQYKDVVGTGKKEVPLSEIDPEVVKNYACEDVDITFRLHKLLNPIVEKKDVKGVLENIELPLVPVLAQMEQWGVKIDTDYFGELGKKHIKHMDDLEKKIYKVAGGEININSTKDLQVLLFDNLDLPRGKKTKTGYSTDVSVLEGLKGQHPVVDYILGHRKSSKLYSTYIKALPELINPDSGRIHTSYSQTIAATGRLSSINPNLQNIPIKDDDGREIRHGFIAEDGFELMSVDYSQVELRLMAHFSDDPNMIKAFAADQDIHRMTAGQIFRVGEELVTPAMRNKAKVVNFSIIYGITPWGLGRALETNQSEAKEYIELYLEHYAGVKNYMEQIVEEAEQTGFVETLFGRPRMVVDIKARNRFQREAAKRIAINSPIQGTSADIIKMAMIDIHNRINKKKYKSRMLLQVHDELVFEVAPDEKTEFTDMVVDAMENVKIKNTRTGKTQKLKVPLKADVGFGPNWDAAH